MLNRLKIKILLCVALTCVMLAGCPGNEGDNGVEEVYHIGTWTGRVETKAMLVMWSQSEFKYWNAAWHIEANIHLNEYNDGSLSGTAQVNFYHWNSLEGEILEYGDIAAGQWDQYTLFDLRLNGQLDEAGYTLTADKMPMSVPDTRSPGDDIDIWDFLFPGTIQGSWAKDGTQTMQGVSINVQGDDFNETRRDHMFREFSIEYNWLIDRL